MSGTRRAPGASHAFFLRASALCSVHPSYHHPRLTEQMAETLPFGPHVQESSRTSQNSNFPCCRPPSRPTLSVWRAPGPG